MRKLAFVTLCLVLAACAKSMIVEEDAGDMPPFDSGTPSDSGSNKDSANEGGNAMDGGADAVMDSMFVDVAPDTGCNTKDGGITFSANGSVQSGSIQMWTVPNGVCKITIDAFGAQGGGMTGGKGAEMRGDFDVIPGHILGVIVGQRGSTNACGGQPASGGGGGGSFVWDTMTMDAGVDPMIAAGGGGGSNDNWNNAQCRAGIDAVTSKNGTQGNGNTSAQGGQNGMGGNGNAPSGTGSGGAGWFSKGQDSTYGGGCTGGLPAYTFTGGTGSNSFGPGGHGGFGGGGGAVCGCGGGGGYSGGGAGEGSSCRAGGGGGGSFNAGKNPMNTAGARTGDGQVIITW